MQINLSEIGTFHVGSFVHAQSWGKRIVGGGSYRNRRQNDVDDSWSPHDFKLLEQVGSGHFGCVHRGVFRDKNKHGTKSPIGKEVALKRFYKRAVLEEFRRGGRALELLEREVSIHSSIQHTHVLPFLGFFEDHECLSMVLKYAPHGDLLDFMVQFQGKRRMEMVRTVLSQVASALAYLQALQIAHRDIKPENLLVASPNQIQVADFGWACWWKPGQLNCTLCGTPEYVSPECLAHPRRYQACHVDSWALGVLAWELMYGVSPFHVKDGSDNDEGTRQRIFESIRRFQGVGLPPPPQKVSVVDDFCYHLLQVRPDRRLDPRQALDHPLLTRNSDSRRRGSSHPHSGNNFSQVHSQPTPTVAQRCQLFQHTSQVHCL